MQLGKFTGEAVVIAKQVNKLEVGDKVLVPSNIALSQMRFLSAATLEAYAQAIATGGIFGYFHTCGGYHSEQGRITLSYYNSGLATSLIILLL